MKNLFIFILCFLSSTGYAQVQLGKDDSQQISIGQHIDSTNMVASFGIPIKYRSYFDDECYQAEVTIYKFKGLSALFVNNVLESFDVDSLEFVITINDLYRVKIGDSAENFLKSIPSSEVIKKMIGDKIKLLFRIKGTDIFYSSSLILLVGSSGVIERISWYSPV